MKQLKEIVELLRAFWQSSQDKKDNNKSRHWQLIYQEVQTPVDSPAQTPI